MKRFIGLSLIAIAALGSAAVQAQTYPSRAIEIVVPFPPGGAMDTTARLIGDKLAPLLGQPIIVQNKAGGGGSIGAASVARAKPDGYTLLMTNQGPNVIREILYPDTPYRTARDLAPVSILTRAPLVLLGAPASGISSAADLLKSGRNRDARPNFGSAGVGSQSHIAGEALNIAAGTSFAHVAYNGAARLMTDLIAGVVQIGFFSSGDVLPRLKDERIKPIAVASNSRFSGLPQVPTMVEAGLPALELDVWYGFAVPAGTPAPIIETLNRSLRQVLGDAEVKQRLQTLGVEASPSTPEQMRANFARDHEAYSRIIKTAGIKPE